MKEASGLDTAKRTQAMLPFVWALIWGRSWSYLSENPGGAKTPSWACRVNDSAVACCWFQHRAKQAVHHALHLALPHSQAQTHALLERRLSFSVLYRLTVCFSLQQVKRTWHATMASQWWCGV